MSARTCATRDRKMAEAHAKAARERASTLGHNVVGAPLYGYTSDVAPARPGTTRVLVWVDVDTTGLPPLPVDYFGVPK